MTSWTTFNWFYAILLGAPAGIGLIRFHLYTRREEREQEERAARQRKYARKAMETRYFE